MEIEYFIMPDEGCPYKIPDMKVIVYSSEMQAKKKEPSEMKISEALKKGIIKKDWHAYWLANCFLFFKGLGCNLKNFRIRQHAKDELAHYSSDCWDLEYKFPFGWKELTGIADRSNYDLRRHEEFSKKDLKLFIEGKGKVLPHVIAEPSFGVERAFLVVMFDAYKYDKKRENIVLGLDPKISPIKAGIFPIVKVDKKVVGISKEVYEMLKKEWNVLYDDGGAVGRRYARMDEAGTPFCITIDADSIKRKDVTIRERDTTKQIRVKISDLREIFRKLVLNEIAFDKAGKKV